MSDERFVFDRRAGGGTISGTIVDRNGDPVPAASLTSAVLTLVNLDTGANDTGDSPRPGIINGRDAQNVLNVNNVTISSVGVFVWTLQDDDNDMADNLTDAQIAKQSARQMWRNKAAFRFRWLNDGGGFPAQFEIDVRNLATKI